MRRAFHEELNLITERLVEMTRLTASALTRATQSLMDSDLELAESVISADDQIDALRRDIDERCVEALALQQPVARDLRIVVTAMRMGADLERMGDLARHVAKLARLRYPGSAITASLRGTFSEMAHVAESMVIKTGSIIAAHDMQGAVTLQREDDLMDDLHRQVFGRLLSEDWSEGVEAAVDATLLSRYYERFADHAVSVARRVTYLVTGEWGDDATAAEERLDVDQVNGRSHLVRESD